MAFSRRNILTLALAIAVIAETGRRLRVSVHFIRSSGRMHAELWCWVCGERCQRHLQLSLRFAEKLLKFW